MRRRLSPPSRIAMTAVLGLAALCCTACTESYPHVEEERILFLPSAETNVPVDNAVGTLTFTDADGNEFNLKKFVGEKHVVLVITRGYYGEICQYCSTQTSRLLANYSKFEERNAEVVVVFPIETGADASHRDDLIGQAMRRSGQSLQSIKFPVLLDVELKAVDKLGIRATLAKPATYIIDKEGAVRFAYVGANIQDRPSVKALLEQLDRLSKEGA